MKRNVIVTHDVTKASLEQSLIHGIGAPGHQGIGASEHYVTSGLSPCANILSTPSALLLSALKKKKRK